MTDHQLKGVKLEGPGQKGLQQSAKEGPAPHGMSVAVPEQAAEAVPSLSLLNA